MAGDAARAEAIWDEMHQRTNHFSTFTPPSAYTYKHLMHALMLEPTAHRPSRVVESSQVEPSQVKSSQVKPARVLELYEEMGALSCPNPHPSPSPSTITLHHHHHLHPHPHPHPHTLFFTFALTSHLSPLALTLTLTIHPHPSPSPSPSPLGARDIPRGHTHYNYALQAIMHHDELPNAVRASICACACMVHYALQAIMTMASCQTPGLICLDLT